MPGARNGCEDPPTFFPRRVFYPADTRPKHTEAALTGWPTASQGVSSTEGDGAPAGASCQREWTAQIDEDQAAMTCRAYLAARRRRSLTAALSNAPSGSKSTQMEFSGATDHA